MGSRSIYAHYKHCSRLMIHSAAADCLSNEARGLYLFMVGDGGDAALAKVAYDAARAVADEARKRYFAARRDAENDLRRDAEIDRLYNMLDACLQGYLKQIAQLRADDAQAVIG